MPGCFDEKCLFCVPLPNGCCLIVWFHMIMSLLAAMSCVEEFREAALQGYFPLLIIHSSIAVPFHASAALIEFLLASLLIVGFIRNSPLFLLLYLSMALVWAGTLLAVGAAQLTNELPHTVPVTLDHRIEVFMAFLVVAVCYTYFAWMAVQLQKYVRVVRLVRDEEMRQFVADLSDRRRLARMSRVPAPRKSMDLWDLEARGTLSQSLYPSRRPSMPQAPRHSAAEVEIPSHVLYMSETGTRASDSFSEDSLTSVFSKTSLRESMARNAAIKGRKDSSSKLRSLESERSSKMQNVAERRLGGARPSTDPWAEDLHSTLENLKAQDVFGSSAKASRISPGGSRRGSVEQDPKAQELELIGEALQTTRGGEPMRPLPEVEEDSRSLRPGEEPAAARATRVPASDAPLTDWSAEGMDQARRIEPSPWVSQKLETRKAKAVDQEAEIEVSEEAENQKTPKTTREQKQSRSPGLSKIKKSDDSELKVILPALPSAHSHDSADVSELWKGERPLGQSTPEETDSAEAEDAEQRALARPSGEKPAAIHSWPWKESLHERIKSLSKEREMQKSTSLSRVPREAPQSQLDASSSGKAPGSSGQMSDIKSQKSLRRLSSQEERMESLRKMTRRDHVFPQRVLEEKRSRTEVGEETKTMKEEKRVPAPHVSQNITAQGPSRPHTDGTSESTETTRRIQFPKKEEGFAPAGLSSAAAKSKATTRKSEAPASPRAGTRKQGTKNKVRPPRRKPTYPRRSESESDSNSSFPISSSLSSFSSLSSLSSSTSSSGKGDTKGIRKSR